MTVLLAQEYYSGFERHITFVEVIFCNSLLSVVINVVLIEPNLLDLESPKSKRVFVDRTPSPIPGMSSSIILQRYAWTWRWSQSEGLTKDNRNYMHLQTPSR